MFFGKSFSRHYEKIVHWGAQFFLFYSLGCKILFSLKITGLVHKSIKLIPLTYIYLCRIFKIAWQQKITNKKVLRHISLTTMYFTLSKCRLCWLGQVLRMGAKQILKFAVWPVSKRNQVRPKSCFKELGKPDLKSLNASSDELSCLRMTAPIYRSTVHKRLKERKKKRNQRSNDKHNEFYLFLLLFICILFFICLFYFLQHCFLV